MEWLKAILGEALTPEIQEQINKELPKHFAKKADFNSRGEEIKTLNGQLETANTSIKELGAKAETSETLKADIAKINGEFETFKADTAKRETNRGKLEKLKTAISKKFNPDAVDFLVNTFNPDDLNLTEAGEIVDIDSKMTALSTAKPGLALEVVDGGTPPTDKPLPPGTTDWSKKSDAEYYEHQAAEAAKNT